MGSNNLDFQFDQSGRVITDDEELNRIIRAVEMETGSKLGAVIPAVTFDDDPDSKVYLILLTMYNEPGEDESVSSYTYKEWTVKVGRQAAYDYLKDLIIHDCVDPTESFIIAGTSDYDERNGKDNTSFESKAITVFRFMKVMYDEHKILDDGEGFDINEYDPSFEYSGGDKTILEV